MALEKITPLDITIQTMKNTVKVLLLQIQDLEAQRPAEPVKKKKPGQRTIKHPLTGKVRHW